MGSHTSIQDGIELGDDNNGTEPASDEAAWEQLNDNSKEQSISSTLRELGNVSKKPMHKHI